MEEKSQAPAITASPDPKTPVPEEPAVGFSLYQHTTQRLSPPLALDYRNYPLVQSGRMSVEISELAKALSKAQGEMKNAAKNAANPFFKSKYADLASAVDAAKVALMDNGLSITQLGEVVGDKNYLRTILLHDSGQWLSSVLTIEPIKRDPQGFGSALTYMRRYAYFAILGMATDDDDGNAASEQPGKPTVGTKANTSSEHPPSSKSTSSSSEPSPTGQKSKPQGKPVSAKAQLLLDAGKVKEWGSKDIREMLDVDFGLKEAEKLTDQEFAGALLSLRQFTPMKWREVRNIPMG